MPRAGLGPVCVQLRLSNAKDCFLHLPPQPVSQLQLLQQQQQQEECQAIELSWDLKRTAFLSWVARRSTGLEEGNIAEISRHLGQKLGVKDGEQVFLRPCAQVSSCQKAVVEPLSPDDWDILELHSASLERHIMDQIRIVFPGGVFPLWIEKHTVIYIEVGSLMPSAAFGRLERYTELIVSPKLRHVGKNSVEKDIFNEEFNLNSNKMQREKLEKPSEYSSKRLYDQQGMNEQLAMKPQDISQKSIISDIWHLIKNIFATNLELLEQQPSKAMDIDNFLSTFSKSIEMDSIFRLCKRFPYNLDSMPWNQMQSDTVHILSLIHI